MEEPLISQELKMKISFLRETEKLKSVFRVNKTLDGRFENSAEHSWHAALMAILLEEYAPCDLDMLKVTKLLLIHDIVEIDAGDTWLFEEDQREKQGLETVAANRLFSLLPEKQKEEFINLWNEFENHTSEEAKFAAVIDGIQPLLNHLITGNPDDGVIPLEKVLRRKEYIRSFAPKLWPLVENLISKSEAAGLYS
jgi:putative hydrolases of HD superfamily